MCTSRACSTLKYLHARRPVTYTTTIIIECIHVCGQVVSGCLAGAVHVSNYNAGVLRQTQGERKSPVDSKGKSFPLDLDLSVSVLAVAGEDVKCAAYRSFVSVCAVERTGAAAVASTTTTLVPLRVC